MEEGPIPGDSGMSSLGFAGFFFFHLSAFGERLRAESALIVACWPGGMTLSYVLPHLIAKAPLKVRGESQPSSRQGSPDQGAY